MKDRKKQILKKLLKSKKKTMNKKKNGQTWWFLIPVVFALPVIAGLIYTYVTYGKTISEMLLAACKVVIIR